jgi:hypothetical protein
MAVWIVRAGYYGDEESTALDNNVATIHWNELPDLSGITSKDDVAELYRKANPDETNPHHVAQQVWQVWAFRSEIKTGDLVILPLATMPHALAVGEVTGPYAYRQDLGREVRHTIPVEWFAADLPRRRLDPGLLAVLGRNGTVSPILTPPDAEDRIRAILYAEIGRRWRRVVKITRREVAPKPTKAGQQARDSSRPKPTHKATPKERLLEKVIKAPNGCWLWTGATAYSVGYRDRPYGNLVWKGRRCNARRLAYEAWGKQPPLGDRTAECTCGHTLCINPEHLVRGKRIKSTGRARK